MTGYKEKTQLNEKDALIDMLTLEKDVVKTYAMSITEGDSKNFRQVIKNNLTESVEEQYKIFKEMKSRNYYKVSEAEAEKVKALKLTAKETNKCLEKGC